LKEILINHFHQRPFKTCPQGKHRVFFYGNLDNCKMLSLNLTENIIGKRGTLFITTIKILSEKIISLKLYGWLNYPLYSSSSKQNCTKYLLVIVQNCQPWPQHLFWGCFDCYPVNIAVSVFYYPVKSTLGIVATLYFQL